ncbi:MAG: tripartite tricarboxylate transporter substrate binding protein [Betaproteobacteria bacterium]|nr:tripartite tricarboxylate transporter substrate binding protein [Betaproteobacteria bacterium]
MRIDSPSDYCSGGVLPRSFCAAIIGLFFCVSLHAQYPDRPIRVVVPFPPGNAPDLQARLVGEKLSTELRQPVVVENRAGGNTIIGAQVVAQSKPDGYTLYMTTSQHVTLPSLVKNLSFDALRDFVPITTFGLSELSIAVRAEAPINDYAEFLRWAKQKPGALTYGSGGIGSPGHLTCEAIADRAGISLRHIPFKGVTEAMTATISGTVDLACPSASNVVTQIKAGRLKALVTTGDKRHPALPQTPTFREADPSGMVLTAWSALFAPRATPVPVLERLNGAITTFLRTAEYEKFAQRIGTNPAPRTLAQAAEFVVAEEKLVREIIRKAGIQPE